MIQYSNASISNAEIYAPLVEYAASAFKRFSSVRTAGSGTILQDVQADLVEQVVRRPGDKQGVD